jgi:hypothetical protein
MASLNRSDGLRIQENDTPDNSLHRRVVRVCLTELKDRIVEVLLGGIPEKYGSTDRAREIIREHVVQRSRALVPEIIGRVFPQVQYETSDEDIAVLAKQEFEGYIEEQFSAFGDRRPINGQVGDALTA